MACIVEFSGKPGVGKTLACNKLIGKSLNTLPNSRIKGLLSNERRLSSLAMKAISLVCSAGLHYSRLAVILQQMSDAMPDHGRLRLLKSFWNAVYLDFQLWRSVRNHDIVIMDQGFTQLCWANLGAGNEEKIKSLLLTLYAPYISHRLVLVYLEAHDRIFDNNLKLRRDLVTNDLYRFDYLNEDALIEMIDAISSKRNFSLVNIINDVSGEINILPIMSRL
ncbi:hypothetical protein [Billgrantia lactosivorans]|uniref:hypothetical protein n=1 Tax=Billgrantia lactosivorans TaxID=2185141 RepID=UPI0013A6F299|nr:hypothetical protein [Halomonas lactosivorans]